MDVGQAGVLAAGPVDHRSTEVNAQDVNGRSAPPGQSRRQVAGSTAQVDHAKHLAGAPEYHAVFRGLELDPYDGVVIGDGPTVRVVPEESLSGFQGVRVEFSVGWGDCPSGCIYRHFWLFEYRVEGERAGEDWPLVGGLLEEYGDPLH